MLKVPRRNLRNILATEHADLKLGWLCPFWRELGTCIDEIIEVLKDNFVGADMLGNVEAIALVRN